MRKLAKGLYRGLLRLMPSSFRDRHTAEIELALDDESARNESLRFWLLAIADLLWGLLVAWAGSLRSAAFGELKQDLRLAARGLLRAPVFTLLAVGALALGMGANTSVFTLVNEVLLRPLPVFEPNRLVDIHVEQPGANSFTGFSYPEYVDYRDAGTELQGIAASSGTSMRLGDEDQNVRVVGRVVSANYFEVLGIDAVEGRVFGTEEIRTRAHVIVVSDGFWQRRAGGRPGFVGSTIRLNGIPLTVIGVLPTGFSGRFIGFPSEFWIPVGLAGAFSPGAVLTSRADQGLELFGRLAEGATLAAAEASLDAVAVELESSYPVTNRNRRVSLTLMTGIDSSLRSGVLGFAGLLLVLAGLVLVTACLNVSSLLLARGSYRTREMSVRAALGASRVRLVRQLVVETLVLFCLGTAAAIVVAIQANALLRRFIDSLPVPLGFELQLDTRVLAFATAVGLATALATAVSPSLRLSGALPVGALRAGAGQTSGTNALRGAFLVGQVALSLMLLVATGLFVRAARSGAGLDVGFDAEVVSVAVVRLPAGHFTEPAAVELFATLADRLAGSPLIERATFSQAAPIGVARAAMNVTIPGVLDANGEDVHSIDVNAVGDGYFATLGIPLLEGRVFEPGDQGSMAGVAVVNRAMVDRFWPRDGALGQVFLVQGRPVRVVGMVENSRTVIQDPAPTPLAYMPAGQAPNQRMMVVLRSAADLGALSRVVADELAALEPFATPPAVRSATEIVSLWLLPQRLAGRFAGALGALAMILAVSGVYGVVSYTVGRRRRELGIRVALGGAPASQVALVMRGGLVLVAVGLFAGAFGVALLTPLLREFLVDVAPFDPFALGGAVALMASASLFAAYLPARRATRVDPVIALREE